MWHWWKNCVLIELQNVTNHKDVLKSLRQLFPSQLWFEMQLQRMDLFDWKLRGIYKSQLQRCLWETRVWNASMPWKKQRGERWEMYKSHFSGACEKPESGMPQCHERTKEVRDEMYNCTCMSTKIKESCKMAIIKQREAKQNKDQSISVKLVTLT